MKMLRDLYEKMSFLFQFWFSDENMYEEELKKKQNTRFVENRSFEDQTWCLWIFHTTNIRPPIHLWIFFIHRTEPTVGGKQLQAVKYYHTPSPGIIRRRPPRFG